MKKTILIFSSLLAIMGISLASSTPIKSPVNDNISKVKIHQQVPTLAPLIRKVIPSVVSVNVEGIETVKTTSKSPTIPFWRLFPFCEKGSPFQDSPFCKPQKKTERQEFAALGSGVILNAAKGYVVTNCHVISNATKVQVSLNDGRIYDAKIIAKDRLSDLSLLQLIDFKNLTAIKLADSDTLQVGDYSIAIGNPFGLDNSVTSGIISGLERSGIYKTTEDNNTEDFIQTDAPINRGNSGGALVNLKGELIGINTAIYSPRGGNIGIGFAIPSNIVKNITSQMIQYGQVKRGSLGLKVTDLTASLAKAMKININRGVFVSSVYMHSSAQRAGIKSGDVIISINNHSIDGLPPFKADFGSFPIGAKISLGLLRNGNKINVKVTIEKIQHSPKKTPIVYRGLEGANFSNIKIKGENLLKVDSVDQKSNAFLLGLRQGDIILSVNENHVNNIKELHNLLLSPPPYLALHILRGENSLYLLLE
ncbi:MAG: Do family serine endopeptidase [Candidatus Dasytiphilus stammeri]